MTDPVLKTKMDSNERGCLMSTSGIHIHVQTQQHTHVHTNTYTYHKYTQNTTQMHTHSLILKYTLSDAFVCRHFPFYFIALNRTLCVYSKFIQPVLCWGIFGLFLLWQIVMQWVTLNRQQENLSLNFSNNV